MGFLCLMLCLNIVWFHRNLSPFHIITLMSLALSGLLSEETRNSKGIKFIHPPIHTDEWVCTTKMLVFWVQFGASDYSVKGTGVVNLGMGSWYDINRQIGGACWVESSSLSGLQRAERPLCPWAILPCALGLAARYIKTGASVTESALWKLRGLADGHFWRCRSIIKMKSSDWARPGMLHGTEELLSLLLISTLALHLPLSFCLSQVTEV